MVTFTSARKKIGAVVDLTKSRLLVEISTLVFPLMTAGVRQFTIPSSMTAAVVVMIPPKRHLTGEDAGTLIVCRSRDVPPYARLVWGCKLRIEILGLKEKCKPVGRMSAPSVVSVHTVLMLIDTSPNEPAGVLQCASLEDITLAIAKYKDPKWQTVLPYTKPSPSSVTIVPPDTGP
jgi:hypothetical protein